MCEAPRPSFDRTEQQSQQSGVCLTTSISHDKNQTTDSQPHTRQHQHINGMVYSRRI